MEGGEDGGLPGACSRAGKELFSAVPRKSWRGLMLLCLLFSAAGRCSRRVRVTMSSPVAENTCVWGGGEVPVVKVAKT